MGSNREKKENGRGKSNNIRIRIQSRTGHDPRALSSGGNERAREREGEDYNTSTRRLECTVV